MNTTSQAVRGGVLLLDKPLGWSSNQALQRARRLLGGWRAGHTGTLDPLATGLLPLCFGEATKYSSWILEAPKSYRATLHLGMTSSTADGEGVLSAGEPFEAGVDVIGALLPGFVGPRSQSPPMHAALKVDGKPLYAYARAGQTVARQARSIVIHRLDLVSYQSPLLTLDMTVSKGTYVRVLAEEIGAALGCGAYLAGLRRTATGPYELDHALTLERLEAEEPAARIERLWPVDSLLNGVPRLTLDPERSWALQNGQIVAEPLGEADRLYRVYDPDERFLGLARRLSDNRLAPARMMGT